MRTREDFEAFLEAELIPLLEAERAKLAHLRARRVEAMLPLRPKLAIAGVGALSAMATGSAAPLLGAIGLLVAIDAVRMLRVERPDLLDVRTQLIGRVVEFWGPEFSHRPFEGATPKEVAASRLIPEPHDRFSSCDLVTGKHRGTSFRFSEVRLSKRVDRGEYRVTWSGLFIVADFNKTFEGRIFVLPDTTERLLGSVLGRALQSLPFRREGRLVHMEDPEFERHFKVYGEDDHETRYVLSASLMRRIVRFRDEMDSDVRMAFIDGQMLVALPIAADFFRAPPIERVTPDFIRSWVDEIHYVTGILDALDLDTRIWSR